MAKTKVMAACSDGGHWVQMRRILPAFAGMEICYVGTAPAADVDLDAGPGGGPGGRAARYHRVRNVSRRDPLGFTVILWQMARILRAERPDVIVTTGAAPGLVALAMGKILLRSRTVWIDSIANTERLSMSGRLARSVADAWLVQWEHLSAPEGPRFWGAVL